MPLSPHRSIDLYPGETNAGRSTSAGSDPYPDATRSAIGADAVQVRTILATTPDSSQRALDDLAANGHAIDDADIERKYSEVV